MINPATWAGRGGGSGRDNDRHRGRDRIRGRGRGSDRRRGQQNAFPSVRDPSSPGTTEGEARGIQSYTGQGYVSSGSTDVSSGAERRRERGGAPAIPPQPARGKVLVYNSDTGTTTEEQSSIGHADDEDSSTGQHGGRAPREKRPTKKPSRSQISRDASSSSGSLEHGNSVLGQETPEYKPIESTAELFHRNVRDMVESRVGHPEIGIGPASLASSFQASPRPEAAISMGSFDPITGQSLYRLSLRKTHRQSTGAEFVQQGLSDIGNDLRSRPLGRDEWKTGNPVTPLNLTSGDSMSSDRDDDSSAEHHMAVSGSQRGANIIPVTRKETAKKAARPPLPQPTDSESEDRPVLSAPKGGAVKDGLPYGTDSEVPQKSLAYRIGGSKSAVKGSESKQVLRSEGASKTIKSESERSSASISSMPNDSPFGESKEVAGSKPITTVVAKPSMGASTKGMEATSISTSGSSSQKPGAGAGTEVGAGKVWPTASSRTSSTTSVHSTNSGKGAHVPTKPDPYKTAPPPGISKGMTSGVPRAERGGKGSDSGGSRGGKMIRK